MKNSNLRKNYLIFGICLLVLILATVFFAAGGNLGNLGKEAEVVEKIQPPIVAEPVAEPTPKDDGLPHDQLFITVERQKYQDGDLQLIIPKLNLNKPVLNGTGAATLKKGVGLYDYAQLPGAGDCNVSIAGHRNGRKNGVVNDHAPFYYVDKLTTGDYLYLTDTENIYCYEYESTEVVEADDWAPIYSQGFSCLTLTSCEPIGISTHRIIVRGRLKSTVPYLADYKYLGSAKEAAK